MTLIPKTNERREFWSRDGDLNQPAHNLHNFGLRLLIGHCRSRGTASLSTAQNHHFVSS